MDDVIFEVKKKTSDQIIRIALKIQDSLVLCRFLGSEEEFWYIAAVL